MSEKILCQMSRKVICVSESNRITGETAFGLKNAMVIENGIDLNKFNPNNSFSNIRDEFGISPDDFVVGFIGRITLQKDPLTIIKAVESANSVFPNIKALIIGDGDLKESVVDYIRDNNLEDVILTSGFRKDIPDLLSAMDIFCQPSLWEGLSIALLEAMAMKKALVVTPTDGTRDVIINDFNGTITEFANFASVSEKIKDYYLDRNKVKTHGENAMLLVKSRFDSLKVSEQVSELYRDIQRNII